MQVQGILTIDYTANYWTRPRIATLEAHDTACVVAVTSIANQSPFSIGRRLFTGGTPPVLGVPETLTSVVGQDRLAADIGGDSNPVGPGKFLLAFEETTSAYNSSELRFMTFLADGTQVTVGAINKPIGFPRKIAVSKTCGTIGGGTESWAIVYRVATYNSSSGVILASSVSRAGNQLDALGNFMYVQLTDPVPNGGSELDVSSPTDDALGRTFLCVETRVDPTTGRGAILGHAFGYRGAPVVFNVPLVGGSADRRSPVVDSDGCRFAVAYATVYSATDADVRVATYGVAGAQILYQGSAAASYSVDRDTEPAVCAARGAGPNTFGLAWTHFASGAWSMQSQVFRGVAYGGFVPRTTGCGGLSIAATGAPALGETFSVSLGNQPGLHGFLFGLPTSQPLGICPGCIQGVQGSSILGTDLTVTVPCRIGLVGTTMAVQGFRFDPSGGPCLGQIDISDTIDLTIQ
jgi:hypothetical protein